MLYDISIDNMTEILSLKLEDIVYTQVMFRGSRWVYSVTMMLLWVLGEPHYGKDNGSAGTIVTFQTQLRGTCSARSTSPSFNIRNPQINSQYDVASLHVLDKKFL